MNFDPISFFIGIGFTGAVYVLGRFLSGDLFGDQVNKDGEVRVRRRTVRRKRDRAPVPDAELKQLRKMAGLE